VRFDMKKILSLILVLLPTAVFGVTLHNCDSLENANGEYWGCYITNPDENTFSVDTSVKKEGTGSIKITTVESGMHIWYFTHYEETYSYRRFFPTMLNAGYNRMSFWILFPGNYPMSTQTGSVIDFNLNVGTYTYDPDHPEDLAGQGAGHHYYHRLNIVGSDTYWTKVIINTHPGVKAGATTTDPGVDPETWNYFDGFWRFYIQALPYPTPPSPVELGYDVWVDDLQVYTTSEAENDDHISEAIYCTYLGSGNFTMGWRSNNPNDSEHAGTHSYNVYYSSTPLTNANYSTTGTEVTEGPFTRTTDWGHYTNVVTGTFSTGITSGTVYFAIKDISDESVVVSKIDYAIDEEPAPAAVTTSISGIRGGGIR